MLAFKTKRAKLYNGDCIEVMQYLIDKGVAVDSICTDPPYHLTSIANRFGSAKAKPVKQKSGTTGVFARSTKGFMGKSWDGGDIAFQSKTWKRAYKLLKPGGYLAAFSSTRTSHLMAVAIQKAGFDIYNTILYAQAADREALHFMRSLSDEQKRLFIKLIEAKHGHLGWMYGTGFPMSSNIGKQLRKMGVSEKIASKYDAYGTRIKPSWEPIIIARKPLSEKSIAHNMLKHGTGAFNIEATKIPASKKRPMIFTEISREKRGGPHGGVYGVFHKGISQKLGESFEPRWPANVVHDNSNAVVADFNTINKNISGYFYSAKATKKERRDSKHPTIKPLNLMCWLTALITPVNGTVLDIFAGSGTTLEAATINNLRAIGIEKSEDYIPDIINRLKNPHIPKTNTNKLIKSKAEIELKPKAKMKIKASKPKGRLW